jgi:hypothetical protein
MEIVKRVLMQAAVLGAAGAVVYKFFLDDAAREDLKDATLSTIENIQGVYEKVSGFVEEHLDAVPSDGKANLIRTKEQWASIGY